VRRRVRHSNFSQPPLRLHLVNTRLFPGVKLTLASATPSTRMKMSPPKMRSCIVIHVVLLACLTLLANFQRLRGLKGRFNRLCTYPNAPGRRMNVTPVTFALVWTSKHHRAIWTREIRYFWNAWNMWCWLRRGTVVPVALGLVRAPKSIRAFCVGCMR
jgi:hypothetical protein